MKSSLICSCAAAATACALFSPHARALNIVPTFQDGLGYSWNSVDPGSPTNQTRQQVVMAAINEWNSLIKDNQTINMTFDFVNAGATYLAQWNGNYSSIASGTNVYPWTPGVQHRVDYNTYYMYPSQFGVYQTVFTTGAVPPNDFDAYTATLHELGHALGYAVNFYYDNVGASNQVDKWTSHITVNGSTATFDPGGLNVQMNSATDLAHVANSGNTANNLMDTQILNGMRKNISTINLQMLEKAYHYEFVAGDATRDGTVNLQDLLVLAHNYGSTGATWATGDFNGDGKVDFTDLMILAHNFNQGIANIQIPGPPAPSVTALAAVLPAFAQVPEPASLGGAAAAMLMLIRRRRSASYRLERGLERRA